MKGSNGWMGMKRKKCAFFFFLRVRLWYFLVLIVEYCRKGYKRKCSWVYNNCGTFILVFLYLELINLSFRMFNMKITLILWEKYSTNSYVLSFFSKDWKIFSKNLSYALNDIDSYIIFIYEILNNLNRLFECFKTHWI